MEPDKLPRPGHRLQSLVHQPQLPQAPHCLSEATGSRQADGRQAPRPARGPRWRSQALGGISQQQEQEAATLQGNWRPNGEGGAPAPATGPPTGPCFLGPGNAQRPRAAARTPSGVSPALWGPHLGSVFQGGATQWGTAPNGHLLPGTAPTPQCLLVFDQRNWASHTTQKLRSPLRAFTPPTGSLGVNNCNNNC